MQYDQNEPATWTVAEAKARLSEVIRSAKAQGPQKIGLKEPCYIISAEEFAKLRQPEVPLGQWLVDNLANVGEIELPSREGHHREKPFWADWTEEDWGEIKD